MPLNKALAAILITGLATLVWLIGLSAAHGSAAVWQRSRVPCIGLGGAPMAGAWLRFFEPGSTTPQVAYEDAGPSSPHDQPIVVDARGMF